MTVSELARIIDEPETHRKIVGDYEGQYALGVVDRPTGFVLRVEPADVRQFPTQVNIDGVDIPVQVCGDFGRVVPFDSRG